MKRKLRLHRETVRSLEHREMENTPGGKLSGYVFCIPSLLRTGCNTCGLTCGCPTQAGTGC